MSKDINIKLEYSDVRSFRADVLILKYAQWHYGVDRMISDDLEESGVEMSELCPKEGEAAFVDNTGSTYYKRILFIGTVDIGEFNYRNIEQFSSNALSFLKKASPDVKHIAMTIHGIGFGLDETEAFLSQLNGLFKAFAKNDFPQQLTKVSIVENNYDRVIRLQKAFDDLIDADKTGNPVSFKFPERTISLLNWNAKTNSTLLTDTGRKKHMFVAMPFKKELYDTFYYGIQQPIHANNFLCERMDEIAFTGDILTKLKYKIETASAVIADLSYQNPNVYLEVGYAWGIKKPTILLINRSDELRFDVQGQKCLMYDGIRHLEELLSKEIRELIANGEIS